MSYSNDWHISGITGLTDLKDAYRSGGVSILQKVGCPRLENPALISDNSVKLYNPIYSPVATYNDVRFYSIPKYLIGNLSFGAYGDTSLDNGMTSGNYTYNTEIRYKDSYSHSAAKWWNFDYIPVIFFDTLTKYDNLLDYEIEQKSQSIKIKIKNSVFTRNTYVIPKSVCKSLYLIEEPGLTLNRVDIRLKTFSLFYVLSNNITTNRSYYFPYFTWPSGFSTVTRTAGSQYWNGEGIWVDMEHIFYTNTTNLYFEKLYGVYVDTDKWKDSLYSLKGTGVYAVGDTLNTPNYEMKVGGGPQYSYDTVLSPFIGHLGISRMSNSTYYGYGGPIVWDGNTEYLNLKPYSWIHTKITSDGDFRMYYGVLATHQIYFVCPKYVWLFTQPMSYSNYSQGSNFLVETTPNVNQYRNDDDESVSVYQVENIVKNSITPHASSDSSAPLNVCAAFYKHGPISYAPGSSFSHTSRSDSVKYVEITSYPTGSNIDLPFPYRYVSSNVNTVSNSDFITDDTSLRFSSGNKHLYWFGNRFWQEDYTPNPQNPTVTYGRNVDHGIVVNANSRKRYLSVIDGWYPSVGSVTASAIDVGLSLASSSSAKLRRAVVGFMTEPVWFEYDGTTKKYILCTSYRNAIAEYPIKVCLTLYTPLKEYVLTVSFDSYGHTYTQDDNGQAIDGYFYVNSGILTYFINGTEQGFETGYASLTDMPEPQRIVYVEKQNGYNGTLTSATAIFSGQTYTSSVVEDGKIKFALQNNGNFTVTSITTSDNYTLLNSNTISVTSETQTCYITTKPTLTPTYYSTSAGGGMYRYFGWRGSDSISAYGKLTSYINIDGTIRKFEDSSAHSFTYSNPIYDSVRVQDPISGDEHIATLVYSKLQWGYASDQLLYTETEGIGIELSITNHVLSDNSNYNPKSYEDDGKVPEYAEYYETSSLPNDCTKLTITLDGVDYTILKTSNRFLEYQYYYHYESQRTEIHTLVFDTATNRIFLDFYDSGDISESDWDSYNYGYNFTISRVIAM